MSIVTNYYGKEIDFNAATMLMDDEICDSLHEDLMGCSDQFFFEEYCKLHEEKYDDEFEPNKRNGQW